VEIKAFSKNKVRLEPGTENSASPGILGKKIGMTQVFTPEGRLFLSHSSRRVRA